MERYRRCFGLHHIASPFGTQGLQLQGCLGSSSAPAPWWLLGKGWWSGEIWMMERQGERLVACFVRKEFGGEKPHELGSCNYSLSCN